MENLNFIINHNDYEKYMSLQKKRKSLTGTIIDYISDEDLNKIKEKKQYDLTEYDPTSIDIKKHFDYVDDIYQKLTEKHPSNEFLKELNKEENLKYKYFTDWYKKYE